MKHIQPLLLLLACISLTGCTTATNYTKEEYVSNNNQAPKLLFGVMKIYPGAAAKILSTPMIATKPAGSTYIYTTTTVKDSKGHTTTYTTTGYVR